MTVGCRSSQQTFRVESQKMKSTPHHFFLQWHLVDQENNFLLHLSKEAACEAKRQAERPSLKWVKRATSTLIADGASLILMMSAQVSRGHQTCDLLKTKNQAAWDLQLGVCSNPRLSPVSELASGSRNSMYEYFWPLTPVNIWKQHLFATMPRS